jgi:hypothetical protein
MTATPTLTLVLAGRAVLGGNASGCPPANAAHVQDNGHAGQSGFVGVHTRAPISMIA